MCSDVVFLQVLHTFICKQILVTKSLHLLHTTMGGGCIHTLPCFKLNFHLQIVCQCRLLVQCMQMDLHTGPQMVTRKFVLPRWQRATAAQPDSTIQSQSWPPAPIITQLQGLLLWEHVHTWHNFDNDKAYQRYLIKYSTWKHDSDNGTH